MLRFPCLVLDHDDTVVASSKTIHYPAFLVTLRKLRPQHAEMPLDVFASYCYEPGFFKLCTEIMAFDEEEMKIELQDWLDYVAQHIPAAFPGIRPLLERYLAEGGKLCVVSHSTEENIRRDYRENGLPQPELVFGGDEPEERRKPSPWPLERIMAHYVLAPGQLLMVDDLKPGRDMAQAAGVPFAFAGWGALMEEIWDDMACADYRLRTVADLEALLFTEE
jgi:phosphoglycolate phosphatase/pyrophosphatase PpaX